MLSQAQLIALKAFLDANAATYAALSDQAAAETLNAKTVTRIKSRLSGSDIFLATDAAEFDAKTDAQRSEWLSLCAIDSLNPAGGTPAAATAIRLFGGGSATVTALLALRSETISPAASAGLPLIRADYVRVARAL